MEEREDGPEVQGAVRAFADAVANLPQRAWNDLSDDERRLYRDALARFVEGHLGALGFFVFPSDTQGASVFSALGLFLFRADPQETSVFTT